MVNEYNKVFILKRGTNALIKNTKLYFINYILYWNVLEIQMLLNLFTFLLIFVIKKLYISELY